MYDALVFDVDGVLLRPPDRDDVLREVIAGTFRAFDVEPSETDIAAFYEGEGETADRITGVCERHGLDRDEFWSELERRTSGRQHRMMERGERTLYDGATALPDLADRHDLALVSNNTQSAVEFLLAHFDLGEHVETAYGREPTVEGFRRRKPDPHYVERALSDLGTRSTLLVGDREADVVAARRAGIDSALVRRDHADPEEKPTHEIERLTDLPELLEEQ